MDVGIDDSFFEKQISDSCEVKVKEKENYCARRCEPRWFLEEDCSSAVTTVATPVKSTNDDNDEHRERSKQAGADFMLLKYRADLSYSLKDFRTATPLFEQVLELLPQMNAMVKREVTDSLARCYSKLGEYERAKEKALQLVLPPYDSDASSWKLLSLCQKGAGDLEDHMLSLQKCVALGRQHGDFWLSLAEGYRHLKTMYNCAAVLESTLSTDDVEQQKLSEKFEHILSNTVSLFRPYFSWRSIVDKHKCTEMEGVLYKEELVRQLSEQEISFVDETERDRLEAGLLSDCHKDCPLFPGTLSSQLSSPKGCFYSTAIAGLSTPSLSLCVLHSPFVVLASRQVTAEDFIKLLNKTMSRSVANTLLCHFCDLAECSCYLWARQLLFYSERYSYSFVKATMTSKLKRLEEMLNRFDQQSVKFLLKHFTQRTVFEQSTSDHRS